MTDEHSGVPGRDGVEPAPDESRSRSNEPLILALIGLGVAALLFAASALPVIMSRGDDDADDSGSSTPTIAAESAAASPTTPSADDSATTESGATTSDPATTTEPENSTTTSTTTEPAPTGDVPESVAIVLGGRIFLEGAVPDEASRDEIVALASEIFTPDNVIDNYIIDERAGDPNLGNIRVDDTVLFATDSARISPDFEPLLNQGLALLTIRPAATFIIEGHTDSRGGDQYNLELSQARADAVVRWYTDRGVDGARLTAIGKGETEPIASDDTAEGRERNRRIEVTIENLLVEPG